MEEDKHYLSIRDPHPAIHRHLRGKSRGAKHENYGMATAQHDSVLECSRYRVGASISPTQYIGQLSYVLVNRKNQKQFGKYIISRTVERVFEEMNR